MALGQRNSSAKYRETPAGRFADKHSGVWSRAMSQAMPLMYSRALCKSSRDIDLSACYPTWASFMSQLPILLAAREAGGIE